MFSCPSSSIDNSARTICELPLSVSGDITIFVFPPLYIATFCDAWDASCAAMFISSTASISGLF
ncbi:MAG: hypothetical protein J6S91_08015, partial [Treponema sp.]|nr:hypothetical protein [Treponema sp.]